MDKRTFLEELEKALSVLQEDELKDIVSEYEQHIDMKVQSGLSEEEAIADFGSIRELTADILEAYHVRADYASRVEEPHRSGWSFGKAAETGAEKGKNLLHRTGERLLHRSGEKHRHEGEERILHQSGENIRHEGGENIRHKGGEKVPHQSGENLLNETGDVCVKAGRKTAAWLCRAGDAFRNFWKKLTVQLQRPVQWARIRWGERQSRIQEAKEVSGDMEYGKRSGVLHSCRTAAGMLGDVCYGILRFFGQAVCWGIRMCWNAGWICCALVCGGMGVFCLFGLGMLAVLWAQGYPLAGVTIGCLGLNLCLFAAAGMSLTFLWKRHKKVQEKRIPEKLMPETVEPECEKEVQHA